MTLNTQLHTFFYGRLVGSDPEGNRFYENRSGTRRWVIFNGEVEASRVCPEWHGWLHHTWAEPPTVATFSPQNWEKPHQPNLTGTPEAYVPPGSLRHAKPHQPIDYEAWRP